MFRVIYGILTVRPVFLTDWLLAIPREFHCPIMTKIFGDGGHSWLCPSCDDEPLEDYVAS